MACYYKTADMLSAETDYYTFVFSLLFFFNNMTERETFLFVRKKS